MNSKFSEQPNKDQEREIETSGPILLGNSTSPASKTLAPPAESSRAIEFGAKSSLTASRTEDNDDEEAKGLSTSVYRSPNSPSSSMRERERAAPLAFLHVLLNTTLLMPWHKQLGPELEIFA
ncbi:hypothetical protein CMV_018961 [Castanea mollissima]|uniref:Uncharacterized protein n=1 Tax=Castanea mollissima TaxID=60419 RepID=A0A8J4VN86_9ROSI|nr:hypothetical protein CMV_018961 [Castanea mollissima]